MKKIIKKISFTTWAIFFLLACSALNFALPSLIHSSDSINWISYASGGFCLNGAWHQWIFNKMAIRRNSFSDRQNQLIEKLFHEIQVLHKENIALLIEQRKQSKQHKNEL